MPKNLDYHKIFYNHYLKLSQTERKATKLLKERQGIDSKEKIVVCYHISQNLKLFDDQNKLIKLEIEDNSIGSNDIEFLGLKA